MTAAGIESREQGLLILAPTERDAVLAQSVLQRAGIACTRCADLDEVCDTLEAVVLSCDPKERRISLSIKSMHVATEKAEFEQYMGSQGESTSTFGDLLKQTLNNRNN